MEILILRKEQKRLLVTPSNFEIYEKNIARYDVLNNCARLESEPFRPIFDGCLESSVEAGIDSLTSPNNAGIATRADILSDSASLEKEEEK